MSPFFRAYSSSLKDHFYTADYHEMMATITNGTYTYDDDVGLVWRIQTVATMPWSL